MATTLQELNEVLLRDGSHIQALLQEIQQRAAAADAAEAEETAERVGEQVDRIAAWGASRQEAWSGNCKYVHRFLRDVVRLDPDRALSQRLLDQVRGFPAKPFAFVVAAESRIRLLRSVSAKGERPPFGRPSDDRERELAIVGSDEGDAGPDLEELVEEALQDEPAAQTRYSGST